MGARQPVPAPAGHRGFRQRRAAAVRRVQEHPPQPESGVRDELRGLPRHHPARLPPQRGGAVRQRGAGQGRLDHQPLGALPRVEAAGRGGAGRGRHGDAAQGRLRQAQLPGPRGELHPLRRLVRRDAQDTGPQPPVPGREPRRRGGARAAGAGGEARRLLAHPGRRQELLDGAVHAQGAPLAGRQLHLPGADRPRRPRHPDLQDLRGLRRGGPRPRPLPGAQRRAPGPAAGRAQVARLRADPEVQPGRGPGRGLHAPRRRHRHQRRGAPDAVRHARPEHAQRPAERRLHRLHRHAAVHRRRDHPQGVRRLRLDLRLPARRGGRGHRAALLRRPRRRSGRGRRRPERAYRRQAGGAGNRRHRRRAASGAGPEARVPRAHRRPAARTGGPRLRAPLLGSVGDRQGDAGLH